MRASGLALGKPVYRQRGIRRLGGVSPTQARAWNLRTCRLDGKGEVQVVAPQGPEYRCEAQGRNGS